MASSDRKVQDKGETNDADGATESSGIDTAEVFTYPTSRHLLHTPSARPTNRHATNGGEDKQEEAKLYESLLLLLLFVAQVNAVEQHRE
jgi:hypothetical protein